MTDSKGTPNSAANAALQHYFDDLIGPSPIKTLDVEPVFSLSSVPQEDSTQAKLAQAERLLAKANSVANLLTSHIDDAPPAILADSLHTSQTHSIPEFAAPPSASILPTFSTNMWMLNEQVASLSAEPSLNQENENSEINTRLDKENAENADIYSKQSNVGQMRSVSISLKDSLPNRFQVLLCEIAHVTIAIPLVELGGIHKLSKISALAKQPNWCLGLLVKGNDKFTCIDALTWLLGPQYAEKAQTRNYQFGVQLGKSPYLLCCDNVSTTIEVCKDDIKWRENTQKRPWLQGMLKERMCALIDGAHMVNDVLA